MSDDESFVVLGSSLGSIRSENSLKSITDNLDGNADSRSLQMDTEKRDIKAEIRDAVASLNGNSLDNTATEKQSFDGNNLENEQKTSMKSSNSKGSSGSLAASFIMGEINADVLKTSVYSQFPSLCSMEACPEDAVKLQNLMAEYVDLKNTLAKVNMTMKQYYSKTQQWKEQSEYAEEQYKQKLEECQKQLATMHAEQQEFIQNINGRDKQISEMREVITKLEQTSNASSIGEDFKILKQQCDERIKEYQNQLATIRNENLELKHDLTSRMESITLTEEQRRQEFAKMNQIISEKTSLINNMRSQIELFEQQQLKSFEIVKKNNLQEEPKYVEHEEHARIVKELERKMSILLAENLDFKDMQNRYIDEINALKVNQVAAEELIGTLKHDVALLKGQDDKKAEILREDEEVRKQIKEEISLLRHQVEVYRSDFEIERNARESIASEKQQLLQELRSLQRKNQELIAAAQKQFELYESRTANGASRNTTKSVANETASSSSSPKGHRCPICSRRFSVLRDLENHVDDCLSNY